MTARFSLSRRLLLMLVLLALFTAGFTNAMPQSLTRRIARRSRFSSSLKAPATGLSVGQQQRLCLARALTTEPEILLCTDRQARSSPSRNATSRAR